MNYNDQEKRSPASSADEPMSSRSTTSDANHVDAAHDQENPFATPGAQTPNVSSPSISYPNSRPESVTGSRSTSSYQYFPRGAYFRSRRVKKGQIERPWLKEKDPREKWISIIPLVGLFVGLCIGGILVWDGVRSVARHKYCEVLNEDFSSWNSNVWTKEVEVGGYG